MKKDNKGFSLVELIIVIAIMAVLIGVLAPTFIKYVEQSRRSTDIQNAEEIRTALEADMADGVLVGASSTTTPVKFDGKSTAVDTTDPTKNTGNAATTIATPPQIRGNLINSNGYFYITYNASSGEVHVYSDASMTYDLTDPSGANTYKNAK